MLRTIFCEVPDFRRVDPVSISGPTSVAISTSATLATGVLRFTVIAMVAAPVFDAKRNAPSTYGVVPLAQIPATTSLRVNLIFRRSRSAFAGEYSAPSTARVIAGLPPAIKARPNLGHVPNVGVHSAASSTATRPLEPAPT